MNNENKPLIPTSEGLPEPDAFDKVVRGEAGEPGKPVRPSVELFSQVAADAAKRILDEGGKSMGDRALREVVNAFRRVLVPPRKRGRKRTAQVTAAYEDHKRGKSWLSIYLKHIPGYATMSQWKKEFKTRRLRGAVRSRVRRDVRRMLQADGTGTQAT